VVDRDAATISTLGEGDSPRPRRVSSRRPAIVCVRAADGSLGFDALAFEDRAVLGRGLDASVVIEDEGVSRRHAEITMAGDRFRVRDLDSTHGTFVNGARVPPSGILVDDAAVLRVGRAVYLLTLDASAHVPHAPAAATLGVRGARPLVGGRWARRLFELASRFASTRLPVLALGETGSGKELAAEWMHALSGRRGALVSLNAASLGRELADAQLFGHVKGAFSGAVADGKGLFVAADGGTLFLDEVGELEPTVQAKLLRALETGEVLPVGATRPVRVDVRVVAATSRDLPSEIERGGFRRDLYERLAGVVVVVPPLRERTEEIPLLVSHAIERTKAQSAGAAPEGNARDASLPVGPTARAMEALLLHGYPGNVRELLRAVEYAMANARGARFFDVNDLPFAGDDACGERIAERATQASTPPAFGRAPAPTTEAVIEAMRAAGGNVSHAAVALGVHRAQIYRALEGAGVDARSFRDEARGDAG
jgi:DNA-binding NtrC family response regulator